MRPNTLETSLDKTSVISERLADVLKIEPPTDAPVRFISPLEVVAIHYRLVTDFARAPEPIQPSGVRDPNLLASAVARQWAGEQGRLLYSTAIDNAASLLFGLCQNHCFHNGNKRTSLVSTLVHLNRNHYVLRGVRDDEIYQLLTSLAAHNLRDKKGEVVSRPDELQYVTRWLRAKTSRMRTGYRPITFRQLKQILHRYRYEMRNPHKNFIDIFAVEDERRYSFFGLSFSRRVKEHKVMTLSYPGEHFELSRKTLKQIREACGLTEKGGVDAAAFYDEEAIVDYFLNHYRSVLERLAKT